MKLEYTIKPLDWGITAKIPYGENSVRWKFHTAKIPYGEYSIRRKILTAKNLYGEKSYDENSYGENSYGDNSGHGSKQVSVSQPKSQRRRICTIEKNNACSWHNNLLCQHSRSNHKPNHILCQICLHSTSELCKAINSKLKKIVVDRSVCLSVAGTLYDMQIRQLKIFNMDCDRKIVDVDWKDKVVNTELLIATGLQNLYSKLMAKQWQWAGPVIRMSKSSCPRQVLYDWICEATGPIHCP